MSKYLLLLTILMSCATTKLDSSVKGDKKKNKDKECICIEIYQPVCSKKNNKTYANRCFAKCDDQNSLTNGACSI